jgi:hypothetical protein
MRTKKSGKKGSQHKQGKKTDLQATTGKTVQETGRRENIL